MKKDSSQISVKNQSTDGREKLQYLHNLSVKEDQW